MFGRLGPLEIIIILGLLLLVFGGRGKISGMMTDIAKGIKGFRKGLKDPDGDETAPPAAMVNVTPDKDKTKA